jgi:TolB-like protein
VSGEFYDKIKNNSSFSAVSLGLFDLKNVSKPLEVFALSNDGLFVPQRGRMEGKLTIKSRKTQIIAATSLVFFCAAVFVMYKTYFAGSAGLGSIDQSIAVLPFVNMSNDPNQNTSDGISEEILNLLSEIPELKVIARTSSFSFKGKSDDIRAIGEKLGVARILEGSVRKSGNMVRITAQLIRVEDGSHEWSANYEREMDDIFKIQDEIAERVTNRLKVTLFKESGDRYRPSQEA